MAIPAYIVDIEIHEPPKGYTAKVTWQAPWADVYTTGQSIPAWRPIKNQTKLIDSLGWPATNKYAALVCRSIDINALGGAKGSTPQAIADYCTFVATYSTAEWIEGELRYEHNPYLEYLQLNSGTNADDGTVISDPISVPMSCEEVGISRVMVYSHDLLNRIEAIQGQLNLHTIVGAYASYAKGTLLCVTPKIGQTKWDYERELNLANVSFCFKRKIDPASGHAVDHNQWWDPDAHSWKWYSPKPLGYSDMQWVFDQ